MDLTPDGYVERVAHSVIGAAIEVHRHLGPGLLEGIYEQALLVELGERCLAAERQVMRSLRYKGVPVGELRLDLLVERVLVVEVKSVAAIAPVHLAQTLAYLRAADLRLGLLINFNVPLVREGIRRVLNGSAIGVGGEGM